MTWMDEELLARKGRFSPLTGAIGILFMVILLGTLALAFAKGAVGTFGGSSLAALVALGFAPFLIWFIVGAFRGFR